MYTDEQKKLHVKRVQTYLYLLGYDIIPDGFFGDKTTEEVIKFQKNHNLAETGGVDYETWKKLVSEYEKDKECQFECPKMRFNKDNFPKTEGCLIGMMQAQIIEIAGYCENIDPVIPTQILDEQTKKEMNKIRKILMLSGDIDVLDKETFDGIARLALSLDKIKKAELEKTR